MAKKSDRDAVRLGLKNPEHNMAKKAKKTARGRKLDRKLVASKQRYEVAYVAKKTRKSAKAVKKAVSRVGHSRKKVERALLV